VVVSRRGGHTTGERSTTRRRWRWKGSPASGLDRVGTWTTRRTFHAVSEPVSVAVGTGVAAEHGLSLMGLCLGNGENKGDVVVIDEGHEGVVFVDGEDGFFYQVDEAGLVGDVVDGGVDGNDHFAHLLALGVNLALDLQIADTALLGVGTEDIVVLVDETIELVLEALNVGLLVVDLELQVGREDGHDFVTFGSLASRGPLATLVARVLGGRLVEEAVASFTHGIAHRSFGPGDLGFAGAVLDEFGDTSAGGHGVEGRLEVGAGLHVAFRCRHDDRDVILGRPLPIHGYRRSGMDHETWVLKSSELCGV